jgi:hypothetical protein
MNMTGALSYVDRIKNTKQRDYALRIFRYYRDFGTNAPSSWPHNQGASLPESTVNRINSAIRHYMIGDCDIKGNAK